MSFLPTPPCTPAVLHPPPPYPLTNMSVSSQARWHWERQMQLLCSAFTPRSPQQYVPHPALPVNNNSNATAPQFLLPSPLSASPLASTGLQACTEQSWPSNSALMSPPSIVSPTSTTTPIIMSGQSTPQIPNRFAEPATATQQQMAKPETIRYVKSSKGKAKMLYAGYVYEERHQYKLNMTYWRCEERCRCSAKLNYRSSDNHIAHQTSHNHEPRWQRINQLEALQKIRERGQDESMDHMRPAELYKDLLYVDGKAVVQSEQARRIIERQRKNRKRKLSVVMETPDEPQTELPQVQPMDSEPSSNTKKLQRKGVIMNMRVRG